MKSLKLEKMAVDEISVIIGQMVAYFSDRTSVEDRDILIFSLHHLYCQVDYLYQTALPELMSITPSSPIVGVPLVGTLGLAGTVSPSTITAQTLLEELLRHQHIWTNLRAIRHTLNRMEPLCNLLSDATECILDSLDITSETISAHTSHQIPDDATVPRPSNAARDSEQEWLQSLEQERWEQALAAVTESLGQWQQSYNQLALFMDHFALLASTFPSLIQLDEVFNILLDSAAAIFGDILPGFQAISVGDDDAVATLLFDLMHQADQLLLQFDAALEPLQALIEYFALKTNR